ncbi:hypothetical protein PP715_21300 [Ralstonia solanacearum]|nr:hypothetical protein [Ralstonia solanacearum]MBB6587265.1 hypothetical protein [Ralstonia solanacearum]MCG3577539.1 hypothetical protein [Ralstonia solanacearum]MCL9842375.1 hypothetical protein [Ralstonia solanacearum]MDB0534417.1 hypothetical protein [Ralstonia solanacearum]MDB0539169.1 hypothetical protein [Ralstonia solanacearum]
MPILLILLISSLLIGCHLVWLILGSARVSRSPLLIAAVGLLTCAIGFFAQTHIHHAEALPAWFLQKMPAFAVDHAVLDFFDKLVNVVIYAAGGGIISSALFLRTQMRFAQERREQIEIREHANQRIMELERDLGSLEVDERTQEADSVQQRRSAILRVWRRHKDELKKANRILKAMGE